jgi:hypothetical protein
MIMDPTKVFVAEGLVGEVSSISGAWSRVNSWMRKADLSRAFITDTTSAVKRYALDMAAPYRR